MGLPEKTWEELWKNNIHEVSLLYTMVTNYLQYIQDNREYLNEIFSKIFKKKIHFTDEMHEYIAWQTLGPNLINGFQILYSILGGFYYTKSMSLIPFELIEKPENWKNAGSYFKSDIRLHEFKPELSFEKGFHLINEEVYTKHDSTLSASYFLGILKNKTPWDPPECTSSTINLIKEKLMPESIPSRLIKQKEFRYPNREWEVQESKLLSKIKSQL